MKLLLAIDLNQDYAPVFEQAQAWAARVRATLDIVYVGMHDDMHLFVSEPHARAIMKAEAEKLRDKHVSQMEELLVTLPEENRGTFFLPAGPAVPAIVGMEEPYAALIVATHGRRGVAHLWLGSVAEQVVRTSRKPVVVLRLPEKP